MQNIKVYQNLLYFYEVTIRGDQQVTVCYVITDCVKLGVTRKNIINLVKINKLKMINIRKIKKGKIRNEFKNEK